MKNFLGSTIIATALAVGTPSTSMGQVKQMQGVAIQENINTKGLLKEVISKLDDLKLSADNLVLLLLTEIEYSQQYGKTKNNYNNINEALNKYNTSLDSLDKAVINLHNKEPRIHNELNELIAITNSITRDVKETMVAFKDMLGQ